MHQARKLALSTLIPLILTACGGTNSGNSSIPNTPDIDDSGNYYVLSSASLVSDGPANMDTYDLIESVLGVALLKRQTSMASITIAG
ncbi:hypothetical protein JCM19235_3780 [Vibrio maritimus]|uniref:Uncharacterized protein n=1 Tax=Vibrio maritimus TaxID=990268 RepID=A0A090S1T0_9VIBR|nr:hypothetical protein JCM19235_3780 [Vibrio maritimus]